MISIIIPVTRDRRVVDAVRVLSGWADRNGLKVEILVCGEPPPGELLAPARVVEVKPARKGECVRAGVRKCRGRTVLICDADVPVRLSDLDRLLAALTDFDIAVGVRCYDTDFTPPFGRRLASRIYKWLVCSLLKLPPTSDPQCGVKVFRVGVAREVVDELSVVGLAYDSEILRRAETMGSRVAYVPVLWKHTSTTISLWRHTPRMLCDLLYLWFRYEVRQWRPNQ